VQAASAAETGCGGSAAGWEDDRAQAFYLSRPPEPEVRMRRRCLGLLITTTFVFVGVQESVAQGGVEPTTAQVK
jgi:hypothetical protein